MLQDLGVGKGDRVIIYMPMVPEAVIAMLACARIGAVHSVVFGGFAAKELATRIDDAKPKVILSASLRHRAAAASSPTSRCSTRRSSSRTHKPEACLILQRPQARRALVAGRDHRLAARVRADAVAARKPVDCVPVAATDPLYILYTSGTTGSPKGVVRDNGGHMVALKWSMKNLYGVEPGEVFWAASDVGWVVGHSYIVYAPLLHGCTTILYEGKPVGTPDAGAFWRVIAEHGVRRAVHRADRVPRHQEGGPEGRAHRAVRPLEVPHAVPRRRARRSRHDQMGREACSSVPVIDHWWQTETGWAIAGNPVGLGAAAGQARLADACRCRATTSHRSTSSASRCSRTRSARSSSSCRCRRAACRRCGSRTSASRKATSRSSPATTRPPTPASSTTTAIVYVMSRTDDIINVAGHRLSTGGMEEVLAAHPDVAECAVIGIADELKGEVPCGFVVLKAGVDRAAGRDRDARSSRWCASRSARSRPSSSPSRWRACRRRARARSCAAPCKKIADGEPWTMPATIDDPAILDEIGRR